MKTSQRRDNLSWFKKKQKNNQTKSNQQKKKHQRKLTKKTQNPTPKLRPKNPTTVNYYCSYCFTSLVLSYSSFSQWSRRSKKSDVSQGVWTTAKRIPLNSWSVFEHCPNQMNNMLLFSMRLVCNGTDSLRKFRIKNFLPCIWVWLMPNSVMNLPIVLQTFHGLFCSLFS